MACMSVKQCLFSLRNPDLSLSVSSLPIGDKNFSAGLDCGRGGDSQSSFPAETFQPLPERVPVVWLTLCRSPSLCATTCQAAKVSSSQTTRNALWQCPVQLRFHGCHWVDGSLAESFFQPR
jgi:hypothetical protein